MQFFGRQYINQFVGVFWVIFVQFCDGFIVEVVDVIQVIGLFYNIIGDENIFLVVIIEVLQQYVLVLVGGEGVGLQSQVCKISFVGIELQVIVGVLFFIFQVCFYFFKLIGIFVFGFEVNFFVKG